MRARFETGALIVCAAFSMATAEAAETPPHIDASGVNMQPAYPASAAKANEQGAAVLDVEVGVDGKVKRIRLHQTSGFNDLDSAAISAVMGWRFVPATRDGENIAGATTIALGFQPPAQGDAAQAPAAAPKPAADLFPPSLEIEAPFGQDSDNLKPVPCPHGQIRATIQILHSNGPTADSRLGPRATLVAKAGDESVWVGLKARENISPAEEDVGVDATHAEFLRGTPGYSTVGILGRPLTVSISWDRTRLITARAGGMETDKMRTQFVPTQVGLSVSAGAARFINPEVTCLPEDVPDSDQ